MRRHGVCFPRPIGERVAAGRVRGRATGESPVVTDVESPGWRGHGVNFPRPVGERVAVGRERGRATGESPQITGASSMRGERSPIRRPVSSSILFLAGVASLAASPGCHRDIDRASTSSKANSVARNLESKPGPPNAVDDVRSPVASRASLDAITTNIPDQPPDEPAPDGMVWVPGGTFWMGADDPSQSDANPVHEVKVAGFWMDRTEVTNRQFARFVAATGYITVAERKPDPKDFPGAPLEKLVPGSIVFTPPVGRVSFDDPLIWWRYVPGANWRHPEGPASTIVGKDNHPVVQVCWYDAVAYANWAGKRLPTEAEWEYAARGKLARTRYTWGDERRPGGKPQANTWDGDFPGRNTGDDGYSQTAPVGSFPPNTRGLFDMSGNVWEWCSDWYRPSYEKTPHENPLGPESSFDPGEPNVPKRVQRGGSFLCADNYCTSYVPGARGKGAPDSSASHIGVRCVRSQEHRP
jgi:formylglycine-generating enzyme